MKLKQGCDVTYSKPGKQISLSIINKFKKTGRLVADQLRGTTNEGTSAIVHTDAVLYLWDSLYFYVFLKRCILLVEKLFFWLFARTVCVCVHTCAYNVLKNSMFSEHCVCVFQHFPLV